MSYNKFGDLGVQTRSSKLNAAKKLGALEEQPEIPASLLGIPPPERFSKLPQWFAVSGPPSLEADPDGYMNMVANGDSVTCHANVLGIQPWVIHVLKKVLHWRYIHHPRTLQINLLRLEDRERLVEEINITFRNYATTLNHLLRTGQIPLTKLESKMKQYEAMEELSAKVYKMGRYKVSGYLLYKVGEGLMKEIIFEREAIENGLVSTADVIPGKPARHHDSTTLPRIKLKFRGGS
ncbi:hypothetical protein TWF970_003100 [Orbilia oligospora]|uniref:Uncharacterized protein n=1 Tax=Orbilia oligospora TaxID=2813651 RepID=A0A7C8RL94_ORBOL|nr:hypothetical protein TWF970_003100 [Orbilia oligospora]